MESKQPIRIQPTTHHVYWALFLAVSLGVTSFLVGEIKNYVYEYTNVDLSIHSAKAASVPTMSFSPSTATVANNQVFAVSVIADTASSAGTDGIDLKSIHFNPAILQVQDDDSANSGVQVASSPLFAQSIVTRNTVNNTTGVIDYSQISIGDVNGNPGLPFTGVGTVVTIHFKAIASGTSAVTFDFTNGSTADTNMALSGTDLLAAVVNGSYTVDATAPTVSITAPANNATVTGTISVSATAGDSGGSALGGVQFKLDGANLGTEDTTAPYSTSWNSATATQGSHQLTAVARDNAGNVTTSPTVNVTVNNIPFDFSASNGGNKSVLPGSATTNSISATLVSGTAVSTSFTTSGLPSGVTSSFSSGSCTPTCTTTMTINASSSAQPATSTITVTATAGSVVRTTTFTLTVGSPFAFSLSNGGNKTVTQGGVTSNSVTATLSSGTATPVSFSASGLPSGATSSFSSGSCTPTCTTTMTINAGGSTPLGNSTVTVTATGGSVSHTSTFTLTVATAADTTPPIVSLTAPTGGATVSGASVTVSATATDAGSGMAGVQFKYDTTNIGGEDTSSPFTVTWNTTSITAGSHTLTAVARDVANNTSSSSITVNVNNNQLPLGNLDQVTTAGVVRGWTFDPDNSATSNQVKIYIDGPSGTGALVGTIIANVDRPDIRTTYSITGNHGFNFTIPSTYQNGSYHSVYAYGVDASDSTKTILLGGSPQSFTVRNVTINPEGRSSKILSGTLSVLSASKASLIDIPFTSNSAGTFLVTLQVPAQATYFKISAAPFLVRLTSVDLAQTSSGLTIPQLFTGDIDQNNLINSLDYSIMNTNWFGSYAPADLNQDGVINSIDYSFMNKHWLVNGDQ